MIQEVIQNLLIQAIQENASDVHLVSNQPPFFRIHGELLPTTRPPLSQPELEKMIFGMLSERQLEAFKDGLEIDFSFTNIHDYHFRVNVHMEKRKVAANIRIMPKKIPTMTELKLPTGVERLAKKRQGLIIIAGTSGSGKTTTMTVLVDLINQSRKAKIITIEDPVEFIHTSKQSLVIQREVGTDTQSFDRALKYALRQDPDVVVIGEMRDLESISMALTTAETGHLVLTTLHAPEASETVNRIIDVYPQGKQHQIRVQLAETLVGVIGQTLIPIKDNIGRVLATEVLVGTLPVRNIIRRGALQELRGQMEIGEEDMHTLEQSLTTLVKKGYITKETALEYAKHPDMLLC